MYHGGAYRRVSRCVQVVVWHVVMGGGMKVAGLDGRQVHRRLRLSIMVVPQSGG